MTYSNGTLTETKEITYAELEKTYSEVAAKMPDRDRAMLVNSKYAMSELPFKFWPYPPVYPLRFNPYFGQDFTFTTTGAQNS